MKHPAWQGLHPNMTPDGLGILPYMLNTNDPRPAKEQLHENYAHGGGWSPMQKFKLLPGNRLAYPGDPVLMPLAQTKLRDETIILYECEIVAIIQPDGSFEAARMD